MADLRTARLTETERAMVHALGFVAVSLAADDRLDLLVDGLRHALLSLPRRDVTARFLDAAQSVVDAFPRRRSQAGAADWMLASIKAQHAVQHYHWAASCHLAEGGA